MTRVMHSIWRGGGALMLVALGACSTLGSVGNVLGGVLGGAGGAGGNQVSGVVRGVDTRSQYIYLQASDGSNVTIAYDAQTQVSYNNQNYQVTSLEQGDQITATIQQTNNGGYYTSYIQVVQPVQGSGGTVGGVNTNTVQNFEGTVRGIDTQNGLFALEIANYGTVTVSLPYNVSRIDQNRFQQLRNGDYVRIAGVFLNNSRVELRQFY